jgi:hypothetical protein
VVTVAVAVTDESAVDLAVGMATSVAPSAADAGTPTVMQSTKVTPGSTAPRRAAPKRPFDRPANAAPRSPVSSRRR